MKDATDKMAPGAIFLDRDNTLNQDSGYSYQIKDFKWMAGAAEALAAFHHAGLQVFIITNQSGIGRGKYSVEEMHIFNQHLCNEAMKQGGFITDIAFCPHHEDADLPAYRRRCACRKPAPGLLFELAEKWHIDLKKSVMIGDRQSDVDAGEAAGCISYLHPADGRQGPLHHLAEQIIRTHFG